MGRRRILSNSTKQQLRGCLSNRRKIRLTIKDRLISPSGDYASVTLSLGVHQSIIITCLLKNLL